MNFAAKNKTIIIGLGVIVLIALAYLLFFHNSSPSPDLTADATAGSPTELYFVNLAGELNDLTFDTTVLQDPRFTALVDIRTAILPENSGRSDPFAPIK